MGLTTMPLGRGIAVMFRSHSPRYCPDSAVVVVVADAGRCQAEGVDGEADSEVDSSLAHEQWPGGQIAANEEAVILLGGIPRGRRTIQGWTIMHVV